MPPQGGGSVTAPVPRRGRYVPALLWIGLPSAILLSLWTGPSARFGLPSGPDDMRRGILLLRALRAATGLTVGASLAVAGVILQTVLRNPLAEPFVLGVSGGAGLGAALAILFVPAAVLWVPAGAFAGAVLALLLVYRLARVDGRVPVFGLVLSGVIVSSMASNALMFLVSSASREGMQNVLWWMLGSLEPHSVPLLVLCAGLCLAALAGLWSLSPWLNCMTLGDETAHNLGVDMRRMLPLALAAATLLSAAAVSLAGVIGFVGLIVPHVMRSLVGGDHRRLLPAAAAGGGLFLVLCDVGARSIMAPRVMPIGIVTALFGGPFFLFILHRRRREGWGV